MKRKGFVGIDDCFLSPGIKSRRLDGDLPTLMEEDRIALVPEVMEEGLASNVCLTSNSFAQTKAPTVYDGTRVVSDIEEKVMVFSCQHNPKFLLPRNVLELPILIDSDFLPGLEDHLYWPGNSKPMELIQEENKTLANKPPTTPFEDGQSTVLPEPMEAEEPELMELENSDANSCPMMIVLKNCNVGNSSNNIV